MPSKPTLKVHTITSPAGAKLKDGLRLLGGARVLVGVPEVKAPRYGKSAQMTLSDKNTLRHLPREHRAAFRKLATEVAINNAQLLYIHTNGSMRLRIPKRPVIEPALRAPENAARITKQLEGAAVAAMDGDAAAMQAFLQKAGLQGQNASRRWFTDPRNGWPPNSAATARRKAGKIRDPRERAQAMAAIDAGRNGADGAVRPLIDTGILRRSIVFVVELAP